MKLKFTLFLLFVIFTASSAQITWEPLFPTESDSIIVYFNAAEGSKGLKGYTGDVYAHTGVITNLSTSPTDWKYVKTNWGQNTPETLLERVGTDLYKYVIKPNARAFYNVPSAEKIQKVAFVFRSSASPYKEGKTEANGDIFLDIYTAGFNLSLLSPSQPFLFVELNGSIHINAVASSAARMAVYSNGSLLHEVMNDTLNYTITVTAHGKKNIRVTAWNAQNETKADSFSYMVNYPVATEVLPSGIQDGITYNSNTSATLALHAPGKKFVYVIGDFNNWQVDSAYYMKRTPDLMKYWIELKNLSPGKEYAFQYYVDGEIKIADPYSEKILDPWNDQWIEPETYPDLKKYPAGKTENIVGVLQTGQGSYQWQNTAFEKPKKTDLVIYETLIRDFIEDHDLKTLKDTLGYFKRMGVNAIELMPVNEFEGNESWGYNPMMYFAVDKYYGTKNDLKAFIDAAHGEGIAVIIDMVLNHAYGLNPLVRLYWDSANNRPSADNPWFNQVSPNPVFSWGYDFNHESYQTKKFVDRVTSFWLKEYKVDGFRFDFTKGFTNKAGDGSARDISRINILKRMADEIWKIDSAAYVILEHFADNTEEIELAGYGMMLWGNMNYNYNEATMGWNEGTKSDFSRASYKSRGWQKPHLVAYMESHDEERLMVRNILYGNSSGTYKIKDTSQAINRIKLGAAFFLTIPGPKMIWQFGELGYDFSIDYNGRVGNKPIRWDYLEQPRREKLLKVYSALIKLRTEYDAFETQDYSLSLTGPVKSIHLNHESMNVTIIGNFDVVERSINPYFQNTGTWYDYFSGSSIEVSDPQAMVTLKPGEFHIYTTTALPSPGEDILSSIKDGYIAAETFELMQNYPNPFNPSTVISYSVPEASVVTLKIYNLLGEEVKALVNSEQQPGVYNVRWNGVNNSGTAVSSGIYFYKIEISGVKKFTDTKKMILIQ